MAKDPVTNLNPEQLKAVKHKIGPLLVIAGAGTGKTTVLIERVKHLIISKSVKPSEILALTFTEKAAREMEERIDIALPYGYTQMWVMTFHSFCDRILRAEALNIGLDPRYKLMTEAEAVQLLRKNLFKFELNYFRPLGNPNKFLGGMLQHFSRLQDEDINPSDYLGWVKKLNAKSTEKIEIEKWMELAKAYRTYDELKTKEGLMDFGDLIIKTLKLFRDRPNVLKEYKEQFKHVLVDEFQDTNFAQNEMVKLLVGKKGNVTVVADDDQCLPPNAKISTLDRVIKIKDIKMGDMVLTAIGKGHTSLSKVSKIFKRVSNTKFLTFRTESGKKIVLTFNHKMFCFLPAHYDLKDWHFVYIMFHTTLGWRIGITKNLPQRLRLERRADKIIGIGSFKTEAEAKFFEAYYSSKYGIPTLPFTSRPKQAISGKLLIKLFGDIDTAVNIKNLADDLNIELDSPQFLVGAVTRGETRRVKINFEMCARNYRSKSHKEGFVGNPSVLHQVTLETSNPNILNKLSSVGMHLVEAKKGKKIRKNFANLKDAWDFAEKLEKITGGIIDKRFKVGRFNYQHLSARIVPASHVFPGMYLPVLKDKQIIYEKVLSREEKIKKSETYDLEIEKTHNFIADGIVVHNSIYRFRGAAVSNVIQFRKSYPKTKIVVLTKNYRSTQEILDRSYDLIQNNNPDRLEVVEKIDKKLVAQKKDLSTGKGINFIHMDRVENEAEAIANKIKELVETKKYDFKDVAILIRANNHSDPIMRALARAGIPYQFLGPGRLFKQPEIIDLISYLKVLNNFEDSVSFYRLLSIEHFEVPGRDVVALSNYARKFNLSLFEAAEKIDEIYMSDFAKEKVNKIVGLIKKHMDSIIKESAGQLLYYFLEESELLQKLLNPSSAEAEKRAKNISKFFDKLKTYEVDHEDATVPQVVDWIELSMEMGESPLAANSDWIDINAVNILTVHSSKGLEFPIVFLVNLVAQRFPTIERREQIPIPVELIKEVLPVGDYHLEEERRLFYVGMTRAKEHLFFTAADYYGEGKREKKLSPFISEALGDKVVAGQSVAVNSKQLSFLDYANTVNQLATEPVNKFNSTRIDYLSYSQIETFKICPLHYKLRYIYKIPTPASAALSFGTSMHAALKEFYLATKVGEKPTEKLMFESFDKVWIKDGFTSKTHEEKFLEKGKGFLTNYLAHEFNEKSLPLLLEQSFLVPIKSNNRYLKIGGKIDRVDGLGDGKIEIIDYKTGTPTSQRDADHNLQLTFYSLAATIMQEKPFGIKPEEVTLSLYYFENGQKLSTVRTKKELDNAMEEILDVKEGIEKSDFKCSGHMFCQMGCEFSMFCREENS